MNLMFLCMIFKIYNYSLSISSHPLSLFRSVTHTAQSRIFRSFGIFVIIIGLVLHKQNYDHGWMDMNSTLSANAY